MTVNTNPATRLRILGILALLFAIPVVFAWVLYYSKINFEWGKVNHGYLLNPPLQLGDLSVKMINGVAADSSALPKKWDILYVTIDNSSTRQLQIFDKLKRVRLALGKDFSRVRQSYGFNYVDNASNINQELAEHFQRSQQIAIANLGVQLLLKQLPETTAPHEAIFIIDPHGNVVLGYAADVKPDDIYKDLVRLLQYSTIG